MSPLSSRDGLESLFLDQDTEERRGGAVLHGAGVGRQLCEATAIIKGDNINRSYSAACVYSDCQDPDASVSMSFIIGDAASETRLIFVLSHFKKRCQKKPPKSIQRRRRRAQELARFALPV